jgi:hypothetical protein
MNPPPASSDRDHEPDEAGLAVLLACHHRGPLTVAELARLVPSPLNAIAAVDGLCAAALLERRGSRHAVTQRGRDLLDRVLEATRSCR